MSEEETKRLDGRLPQQILMKLEVMDARLQRVEERIDQRGFDTKPIWEQALAQIGEVKEDVVGVKEDIFGVKEDVVGVKEDIFGVKEDIVGVKEDIVGVKEDVRAVKAELGIVHRKIDVFSRDLLTVRAEQVSMDERLRNLEERN